MLSYNENVLRCAVVGGLYRRPNRRWRANSYVRQVLGVYTDLRWSGNYQTNSVAFFKTLIEKKTHS